MLRKSNGSPLTKGGGTPLRGSIILRHQRGEKNTAIKLGVKLFLPHLEHVEFPLLMFSLLLLVLNLLLVLLILLFLLFIFC